MLEPVLIGGTMGTCSYVLAGTERGMALSFGSACHGAGRGMSRHQAPKQWSGREVVAELEGRGILVRSPSPAPSPSKPPCGSAGPCASSLQAVALGLGTTLVGAFEDARVAAVAALAADERPLLIMPVGRPRAAE